MQQATITPPLINFKKERNFSEKLNATFAFLSQNFRPIGKNLLLIAGPFALLVGIFYGIYQTYTIGAGFSTSGPDWNTVGDLSYLILSLVGMVLFSFVATTLVVAIIMRHIRTYMEEGHTNISTSHLWSTIWSDFFSVLGTTFYIGVLIMLSIFVLAIPVGFLSVGNPNPVVIGLFLFFGFFGLMFLWPSLLLLYPIRSMEKKDIISATGRLFKLNSGKWLSTMGIVVVVTIIQSIMSIVFAVPMYIIMFMKVMHAQDGGNFAAEASLSLNNVLLTLASGISMLGSFALYSLLFIALSFQYFNLLERKEAKGLLERMENFGKQQPDTDDHEEQY